LVDLVDQFSHEFEEGFVGHVGFVGRGVYLGWFVVFLLLAPLVDLGLERSGDGVFLDYLSHEFGAGYGISPVGYGVSRLVSHVQPGGFGDLIDLVYHCVVRFGLFLITTLTRLVRRCLGLLLSCLICSTRQIPGLFDIGYNLLSRGRRRQIFGCEQTQGSHWLLRSLLTWFAGALFSLWSLRWKTSSHRPFGVPKIRVVETIDRKLSVSVCFEGHKTKSGLLTPWWNKFNIHNSTKRFAELTEIILSANPSR